MTRDGVNLFKNCYDKKVLGIVTVEDWIWKIKSGEHDDLGKIKNARLHGKNSEAYNEIKLQLPCVTWNYLYENKLEASNIKSGSGFLYIDIDGGQAPGINTLSKEKIHAYFDSLSKTGKGLIVKVKGMPSEKESFDLVYNYVILDLNLKSHDANSQKRTQCNVLTYDPQLHFNANSYTYDAVEILSKVAKPKPVCNGTKHSVPFTTNEWKFRNNNIDEYCHDDEILIDENGIEVIQLYLPRTISAGKRKMTLLSYCSNLVLLNPNKSKETIFKALMENNLLSCRKPLPQHEVEDIVKCVFKYKEAGTLVPKQLKKRKILFGKNTGLTPKEKMSISAKQVGEWKRNKTKQTLYSFLESYSGEEIITKQLVANNTGVSLRTVERYWKEFKAYVQDLNETAIRA